MSGDALSWALKWASGDWSTPATSCWRRAWGGEGFAPELLVKLMEIAPPASQLQRGPERVESAALDDDPAMPSARTMRITTAHGEDRAHVGSLRDDEAFAARQLNHTDGARHVEAV